MNLFRSFIQAPIFLCCIHATFLLTADTADHLELAKKHEAYLDDTSIFQIQCALAAYRTLKAEEIWYVSSPITSGKRLYDYMDTFYLATPEVARSNREAFTKHVILPNIEEAESTGKSIATQIKGVVISPTSFEGEFHKQIASRWSDHTFMAMWLNFIATKVTHIVMLDGWEYSNGASEEFLLAISMQQKKGARCDIKIQDARGSVLSIEDGISLLEASIQNITARHLPSPVLDETLATLKTLKNNAY